MLDLLSLSTEILSWSLTLGLIIGLVLAWDRFSNKRLRVVIARVSVLILIQVLALVSTGITINRSGDFYTSWSDLVGANGNLEKIAIAPNNLASISPSDIKQARKSPGGSLILRKVIKGADSGISDVVYVVLSPKVAAPLLLNPQNPQLLNDYQVIELFPGTPGVPQTWIGAMNGIATIEKLEKNNSIKPTIAIIPSINVIPGKDTECLNFLAGPQVESWLTTDMHTFALKFIGIDARPWATMGYSTGGWCASMVSIRHPDLYSSAVSIAGYFRPVISLTVSVREKSVIESEYDLVKTLRSSAVKPQLMIITGVQDKQALGSAKKFMESAGPYLNIRYVPISSGGHNTKVWAPFVSTGLLWIAAQQSN